MAFRCHFLLCIAPLSQNLTTSLKVADQHFVPDIETLGKETAKAEIAVGSGLSEEEGVRPPSLHRPPAVPAGEIGAAC